MNRQNFENKENQFPLSVQALSFMQEMIYAAGNLSRIGGDNYILSGCEKNGVQVSDGMIVLQGEIMPFKGGVEVPTITVMEEKDTVVANSLTFPDARVRRYAKFASGSDAAYYPWSDFKRLQTNRELAEVKATIEYVDDEISKITQDKMPAGVIVMWSGSTKQLPSGWALCDGDTVAGVKTPDLRGKFIVGYNTSDTDYNEIGNTGGNKQIALQTENTPPHRHLNGMSDDVNWPFGEQGYLEKIGNDTSLETHKRITYFQGYTSTDGEGAPFDNRPPYYVLAYIIKL